jgi:hypothetical protein
VRFRGPPGAAWQLYLGFLTSPEHRRAARAAAATERTVLFLEKGGAVARTPFHSECGGHAASGAGAEEEEMAHSLDAPSSGSWRRAGIGVPRGLTEPVQRAKSGAETT